jgi:AraC-like DNA-binding protein
LRQRCLLDFLLVYIQEGSGRFEIDGTEYEARTNDLFWIPPDTLHEMQGFPPSMVCTYAHFDLIYRPSVSHWEFSIPGGMTELEELRELMHPPVPAPLSGLKGKLGVTNASRVGDVLHTISAEAARSTPYAQLRMSAAILDIVGMILEGLYLQPSDAVARHRIGLEKAGEYLRENCNQHIYMDELAEKMGVSNCYFRRLFKQNFGVSPHEYLLNARLTRAKDLMIHTDMTLSEIALEVGFSSVHSLSRAFRQGEKMTPSQFRSFGGTTSIKVACRPTPYTR